MFHKSSGIWAGASGAVGAPPAQARASGNLTILNNFVAHLQSYLTILKCRLTHGNDE